MNVRTSRAQKQHYSNRNSVAFLGPDSSKNTRPHIWRRPARRGKVCITRDLQPDRWHSSIGYEAVGKTPGKNSHLPPGDNREIHKQKQISLPMACSFSNTGKLCGVSSGWRKTLSGRNLIANERLVKVEEFENDCGLKKK